MTMPTPSRLTPPLAHGAHCQPIFPCTTNQHMVIKIIFNIMMIDVKRASQINAIRVLVTSSFVAALLFSLLADPVIAKVGFLELALAASLLLSGIFSAVALARSGWQVPQRDRLVLSALLVFLCSFIVGLLLGCLGGNSLWPLARSFLPYAIMFIALPLIFARSSVLHTPTALVAIVAVGALQAVYQVYLFFLLNDGTQSSVQILANRITLYDARVTLPFVMAANAIVLTFIKGKFRRALFLVGLSTLFLVASLMTLTRTLVIVCLVSTFVVAPTLLLYAVAKRSRCAAFYLRPVGALVPLVLTTIVVFVNPTMSRIPEAFGIRIAMERLDEDRPRVSTDQSPANNFKLLAEALASEVGVEKAKFLLTGIDTVHDGLVAILHEDGVLVTTKVINAYSEKLGNKAESTKLTAELLATFSSNVPGATEIGGGRISQEWEPAMKAYRNSGPLAWLFGIGVGTPFETADGTPRTYIHNYPIYLLLYNGSIGLLSYLVLQLGLIFLFLRRWLKKEDQVALACLVVLAALGAFSLFFAVHKLIAYNLIMALTFIAAFEYPTIDRGGAPDVSIEA